MSPRSWWEGTALVAGRAVREAVSSRSWRVVTVLMLVLGIAVVVVPRLVGQSTPTYRLTVVGEAPAALTSVLDAAGRAGDFRVTVSSVDDDAAAEAAVRSGDADAALTGIGPGATLYVASNGSVTFPAVVSQAALAQATTQALADAGLSPQQIAAIQSTAPPEQVPVGRVADEGRAGVGFAIGLVLYLSLILAGTSIATAVSTEKSSRISEVLLAVLRPTQLLVGTVFGVGLSVLVQLAALAVPAAVGLATSDLLAVPAAASGDVLLGVGWFVLGLLMYAFVFAALGTLVEKPSEVGSAVTPANVALIASYLLSVVVTVQDPNSWASVLASVFPLSAPLVMPVRWASGLVPGWQVLLAMVLTAAAAVALAGFAARVYARGLTLTGRRLKLREVAGGAISGR